MPRLEVRDIFAGDLDRSPRSSARIELRIGETGRPGANIFDVHVGTPEGVLEARLRNDSSSLAATMLVREWSWPDIERELRAIVARCDTGGWSLSVAQLERHFHHEYQDYDEVPAKLPGVPMIKARAAAGVHLPTWEPLVDEPVCMDIHLTVGIRKQPDDGMYVVTVATPAGLRASRSGFVLANRGVLLISEYRWDAIAEQLEAIVVGCRGHDWAHCRSKLERHFDEHRG